MGRAYVETKVGYNFVQATDEGGFSTSKVITYKQISEKDINIK